MSHWMRARSQWSEPRALPSESCSSELHVKSDAAEDGTSAIDLQRRINAISAGLGFFWELAISCALRTIMLLMRHLKEVENLLGRWLLLRSRQADSHYKMVGMKNLFGLNLLALELRGLLSALFTNTACSYLLQRKLVADLVALKHLVKFFTRLDQLQSACKGAVFSTTTCSMYPMSSTTASLSNPS